MEKKTQEQRVHEELLKAGGSWVNGQYFARQMYLTQYHRAIHRLEKQGVKIEHSKFTDEFGFKSYRIVPERQQTLL